MTQTDDDDKQARKHEAPFEDHELEEIESRAPARAPVIFETIRRMGDEELQRPTSSLLVSGLLAGVALGLSVLAEGLLRRHLPDTEWRPLVENFGYTIGFLVVILGQLQLFTENTITAVCPVLDAPRPRIFVALLRLWGLVLIANVAGASIFGVLLHITSPMQPEVWTAILDLSRHALDFGWFETMTRAIGAGWLIALLVWVMPNAANSKPVMIIIITYLIALADFSHIVAGTTEAMIVVLAGEIAPGEALVDFMLPAFIGNLLGGSVFFTFLAWAQIRVELAEQRR